MWKNFGFDTVDDKIVDKIEITAFVKCNCLTIRLARYESEAAEAWQTM